MEDARNALCFAEECFGNGRPYQIGSLRMLLRGWKPFVFDVAFKRADIGVETHGDLLQRHGCVVLVGDVMILILWLLIL